MLREVDSRQLRRRVVDSVIDRAWRRAKLIVLDLSSRDRIVVQPRFTGALLIDDGALPENERRYSTVEFVLEGERSLHYRDIRRLGTVSVMDEPWFTVWSQSFVAIDGSAQLMPVPVTVPPPLPVGATETVYVRGTNVAVTARFAVIIRLHVAPVQAPLQPMNVVDASGDAVSEAFVPCG